MSAAVLRLKRFKHQKDNRNFVIELHADTAQGRPVWSVSRTYKNALGETYDMRTGEFESSPKAVARFDKLVKEHLSDGWVEVVD